MNYHAYFEVKQRINDVKEMDRMAEKYRLFSKKKDEARSENVDKAKDLEQIKRIDEEMVPGGCCNIL